MPDPTTESTDATWLQMAMSRPVVMRGLLIALVVGSLLCAINHGDCILEKKFNAMCLGKSLFTAIVPYVVSVVSSVYAMRQDRV